MTVRTETSSARDTALQGVDLLAGLAPADLARLEASCTWQRYAVGEIVLSQEDGGTDVLFIASGRLKVQLFSASGQQVIFREIGAGTVFGELAAIDGKPRSATVIAATDSLIARARANVLWQLIDTHRSVRVALFKKLVGIVRDLDERVFEISTLKTQNRVRAHLLRLAMAAGVHNNEAEIRPLPVQSDMADQLATHREAVSREMSALTRDGILKRQADSLLVRDVRRLRALVESEP